MSSIKVCEVLLLRSECGIIHMNDDGALIQGRKLSLKPNKHNLYIVNNDDIELNDWFIDRKENTIKQAEKITEFNVNNCIKTACNKIIGTTNMNMLAIPKLNSNFVSYYIKQWNDELIEDYFNVRVVYEKTLDSKSKTYVNLPLTDSNNCILILNEKYSFNDLPLECVTDMINYIKENSLYENELAFARFYHHAVKWTQKIKFKCY